ncbi:arylamine N-acetyltransferase family protein [[Mycobacterium] nativiensis]|uniref:Arylamine N-acetyltransferase n=1 Tax=[Mycobacterium] nativiensis TaxID=2855503 RepID=A0ABU5XZJ4_9MYCO|nr:arylamine N-acetyltransferase [Mycolicibacter sp. MYC340]MEB3032426.1 arylamine N-acetyltransferase [Mycolicibacter sp. MYC340]
MDRQLSAPAAQRSGIDLTAYFDRVGYAGPTEPTLATLTGLVAAHVRGIPFENLDPLTGVPVIDLGAPALAAKLVAQRRGGYCYEHNNLMRYVLTDLGFDVVPLGGRVVWMSPTGLDGPPHAETHLALVVRIPGVETPYFVDVGFGGQTLTSPIRLVVDEVQETPHEPFRLRAGGGGVAGNGYVLESLIGKDWRPLYTFDRRPKPLIDMQVGSWYVSTYPESIFVVGLSAAAVTDDARWNLRGRNLTVHRRDGGTERVRFDDAAQVCEALTDRFGIDVSGLDDFEARVAQVLDS